MSSIRIMLMYGLAIFIVGQNQAQAPTTLDCLGAIAICTEIYAESNAPSGFGSFANEVNNEITCLFNDENAVWYTFTVNQTGDFGFVLTPNDADDDYDWALWDMTNNTCADIARDASFMVSCNAAGGADCHGRTGATGESRFDLQGGGCGTNPPDQFSGLSPFNDLISVTAGNTYVLMVSNWTGSPNGYEIDFGQSQDIGIFDQVVPEVKSWTSDAMTGCPPSRIEIEFSEAIQCATIASENFQIEDEFGNVYTVALSSADCDIGAAFSRVFTLEVMDPIVDLGNYALQMESTVNNKILDLCENPSAAFDDLLVITIEGLNEVEWPTDTLLCEQSSLLLDVTDNNAVQYLWQDGSSSPTLEVTSSGLYEVTITNSCDIREASINATLLNDRDVTLDLGPNPDLCIGDTHVLTSGLSADLIHQWVDGSSGTSLTVTESDTYGLTVSDACGELATDVITITFEDAPLTFTIQEQVFLCFGDALIVNAEDPNGVNYNWNNGVTTPEITITSGGIYTVEVSNTCETRTQSIEVIEDSCIECKVYVPNAFTSSASNANNQNFTISSNCPLGNYNMKIFDRWGNIQFQTEDPNISWDGLGINGQSVIPGVYAYALSYSYVEFGQIINEEKFGDLFLGN